MLVESAAPLPQIFTVRSIPCAILAAVRLFCSLSAGQFTSQNIGTESNPADDSQP
jgi:hypothetical protein